MKKNRGMIARALLPLAMVIGAGAGMPINETANTQKVVVVGENSNKQQAPINSNQIIEISRNFDDPTRLPFTGSNKRKRSGGEMSRFKQVMKCKKYCRPLKRK